MRVFLSILTGIILIGISIVIGCSKTTILNESESISQDFYEEKSRRLPQRESEDTLHEITFSPRVIGWDVIDGEDTIHVVL